VKVPLIQGPFAAVRGRQSGFAFVWLLFFVAAMGIGLAAIGTAWGTLAKREREKELLFIGNQYRQAIVSFLAVSSNGQSRYPKTLDELLDDPRFPNPVRHLRRPYRDPISGSDEWGLVKAPDGGITGVYSLSNDRPLKTANFPSEFKDFNGKSRYRDWVFSSLATASSSTADSNTAQANASDTSGANPTPTSSNSNAAQAQPQPPSDPCAPALQQSLAACTAAVAARTTVWGTCRNAAVSAYRSCSGQ